MSRLVRVLIAFLLIVSLLVQADDYLVYDSKCFADCFEGNECMKYKHQYRVYRCYLHCIFK
jgi:hypothetical protein